MVAIISAVLLEDASSLSLRASSSVHDSEQSGSISRLVMHASLTTIALTACSLGALHVLTGPDHLSALVALSSGRSWRAFMLGTQWGVGHSIGIMLIALLCITLGQTVMISGAFRDLFQYLVGVFLIVVGCWTWYQARIEYRAHEFPSQWSKVQCQDASYTLLDAEEARSMQLLGSSDCPWLSSHDDYGSASNQTALSLCVGIVHGIAGPGGVLGVLPAVSMKQWDHALVYLFCFCFSSVLCMGVFAAVYGEITRRASVSSTLIKYRMAAVSSAVSIVMGCMWILLVAIGTLDNVFGH